MFRMWSVLEVTPRVHNKYHQQVQRLHVRGLSPSADNGVTVLGQGLQLRQHVHRPGIVLAQPRQKPFALDTLAVQGMDLAEKQSHRKKR